MLPNSPEFTLNSPQVVKQIHPTNCQRKALDFPTPVSKGFSAETGAGLLALGKHLHARCEELAKG